MSSWSWGIKRKGNISSLVSHSLQTCPTSSSCLWTCMLLLFSLCLMTPSLCILAEKHAHSHTHDHPSPFGAAAPVTLCESACESERARKETLVRCWWGHWLVNCVQGTSTQPIPLVELCGLLLPLGPPLLPPLWEFLWGRPPTLPAHMVSVWEAWIQGFVD